MGFFILILVLGALGAGIWLLRRKAPQPPTALHAGAARGGDASTAAGVGAEPKRTPGRMVNIGDPCCRAVKRIETTWYADSECPVLPLEACDMPQSCKCQWMRVIDRRSTHRRKSPDRRGSVRFEDKPDRRSGVDRRKDESNPWKQAP